MKSTLGKYLQMVLLALMLVFTADTAAEAQKRAPRKAAKRTSKRLITPALLRGKIVFARDNDLWMVDPDTRREHMILKKPFGGWSLSSRDLAFSPDLKFIVGPEAPEETPGKPRQFTGNELFIMRLDGTGKKKLTDTGSMQYALKPRFSPDGRHVVYTRRTGYREGGPGYTDIEIRVVNVDGSNDHVVIGNIGASEPYFDAFWSRDGKRLLFTHYIGNIDYGDGKEELQTCALDGSDVRAFDGNYGAFLRPDVSPSSKFRAVIEPANPDFSKLPGLRLFTAQGRFIRELTASARDLNEGNPQWSGDEKRVVFNATQSYTQVDKDGWARQIKTSGIWIIGSNGTGLRRIATNASLIAWLH